MNIKNVFTPSILHTLALVIIGAVIYGVALVLMRDEFLLVNANNIIKKILKRC